MELLENTINMRRFFHECRQLESWIISEGDPNEKVLKALLGVHVNVYDYYNRASVLVFLLPHAPKYGKIFKDVYLLTPNQIPEENTVFLVNGLFLRECLQTSVEDVKGNKIKLHTFDALELLLNSEDSREQMADIQQDKRMFIVGVHGEEDIHLSRGLW